jgi:ornithine carbamoyltransferase
VKALRPGDRALVTIGDARQPVTCHLCQGKVFVGYNVKLNTPTAYRLRDRFAESAISLVCQGCGYVHTFVPGFVQLWPEKDGYPASPPQA